MILILGCGRLGLAVGARLIAAGLAVTGLRRGTEEKTAFPMYHGDLADAGVLATLPAAEAILLCATPGLRRGGDHGLAAGVAALNRIQPRARLVYTGSTAVYADAEGGRVAEDGKLAEDDPAVAGLLAIERAVLARPQALVLRCPALIGPGRGEKRVRSGLVQVAGDPGRPCSFLHADDLADICVAALAGRLGGGVLNAAHPDAITLRELHQATADRLGVQCTIQGDARKVRSLIVDARKLHALMPGHDWRGIART